MHTPTTPDRGTFAHLLLASDGSPAMDATIGIARLIAARDASSVRVITAIEPITVVMPEGALPVMPEVETARRAELDKRVREQLRRLAPESSAWQIEQIDGPPNAMIAAAARECHADLIVMGLGRHGMVDRWFGGETALRVLPLAHAPLLAVAPSATALPRRAVAAIDFSDTSVRAVKAALPLLAPDATLSLVHVMPRDISMGVWPAWDDAYEHAVKASFADLRTRLPLPAALTTEELILTGDPVRELLVQAARSHADLIVTGTHGHNIIASALLGRVSTKLVRGAHCSVFAVSPAIRAH